MGLELKPSTLAVLKNFCFMSCGDCVAARVNDEKDWVEVAVGAKNEADVWRSPESNG